MLKKIRSPQLDDSFYVDETIIPNKKDTIKYIPQKDAFKVETPLKTPSNLRHFISPTPHSPTPLSPTQRYCDDINSDTTNANSTSYHSPTQKVTSDTIFFDYEQETWDIPTHVPDLTNKIDTTVVPSSLSQSPLQQNTTINHKKNNMNIKKLKKTKSIEKASIVLQRWQKNYHYKPLLCSTCNSNIQNIPSLSLLKTNKKRNNRKRHTKSKKLYKRLISPTMISFLRPKVVDTKDDASCTQDTTKDSSIEFIKKNITLSIPQNSAHYVQESLQSLQKAVGGTIEGWEVLER